MTAKYQPRFELIEGGKGKNEDLLMPGALPRRIGAGAHLAAVHELISSVPGVESNPDHVSSAHPNTSSQAGLAAISKRQGGR